MVDSIEMRASQAVYICVMVGDWKDVKESPPQGLVYTSGLLLVGSTGIFVEACRID